MPKFPQIIFKMYRTRNNSNKTLTFENLYKGLPGMHPSSSVRRTSSPEKYKETFFRVIDIVNVKIIGCTLQGVLMDGVAMK